MNTENKDLRFSFPLTDYYVAEKTGFRKYELLTKYDGDDKYDLIIIDENLQPHSLYDYIASIMKNKLDNTHINSSNQHKLASSIVDGFMSAADKVILDNMKDNLNNIMDLLRETVQNNNVDIVSKNVKINNDKLEITCEICRGVLKRTISSIIELDERPTEGFRDEYIFLQVNNSTNTLSIGEETIIYSLNKPIDDSCYFIPIYKIRRRNNNEISIDNKYGKISNSFIEYDEIYNPYDIIEDKPLKTLKTNIKRNINSALLYIPFNGNDNDLINGFSLNKSCVYKKSPFGYMLGKSIDEGDYVQISKKISNFFVEFLLDTTSLIDNDETIITLRDDMLNDRISIRSFGDDIDICIGDINYHVPIDKNHKYVFINTQFNNDILTVFINGKRVLNTIFEKDYTNIRYIQVNTMNVSIGELTVSCQLNNIESIIDDNTYLINNDQFIQNNQSLELINTSIDVFNISNEHCVAKFRLSNNEKISKNDTVDIVFNNNLHNIYENQFTIESINNNILLVKDNNFKIGDLVVIYNNLDNLENVYDVINVDGDFVIINEPLEHNMLHYNISLLNNGVKLVASINGERLSKIYMNGDGVGIMFDKDYPLNTVIDLEFINDKSDKIPTCKPINVTFNGISAIKSKDNNIINLSKEKMTILYNGNQIDPNKLSLNNLLITNDSIDLEVDINMNDFINITEVKNINKVVDIECNLSLSSGSNEVVINGKCYNRGNIISNYKIDDLYIDDNNHIRFNISTKTDIKMGKLILNDLNINVSFKNGELFTISDSNNKITDYLLINESFIYTNGSSEINILYNE